ncbi:hypothetical protein ACI65C_011501 [Semiaphis heraclei]
MVGVRKIQEFISAAAASDVKSADEATAVHRGKTRRAPEIVFLIAVCAAAAARYYNAAMHYSSLLQLLATLYRRIGTVMSVASRAGTVTTAPTTAATASCGPQYSVLFLGEIRPSAAGPPRRHRRHRGHRPETTVSGPFVGGAVERSLKNLLPFRSDCRAERSSPHSAARLRPLFAVLSP